jgi:putative hemolysin
MSVYFAGGCALVASLFALIFSAVSFSLRDFSRARLTTRLNAAGRGDMLQPTLDNARDLIFTTSVCRLFSNIMVLVFVLRMTEFFTQYRTGLQYTLAVVIAGALTLLTSVAVPLAASRYAGEAIIAIFIHPLHWLRIVMTPVTVISNGIDHLFKRASGPPEDEVEAINEEILSVVEEGHEEGIVDDQQREMIESVIEFKDTTAGQIMTARPEMVAIQLPATLADVKRTLDASGHSRIPVYEKSIDQIAGILYARDLLQFLGQPTDQVDVRKLIRPAVYVPETKPLRDLLRDFRLQKIHMAIVSDEYGGTAGLVTIEDVIEELVGDISDEHEKSEPAMLRRIDDLTWEADARVYLDELNSTIGLTLKDDLGYDTLGGFVTTTLGRIPVAGATFVDAGVTYTVIEAEPQKVNRVRIVLPVNEPAAGAE